MRRGGRRAAQAAIVSSIASQAVMALRANLENSEGDGQPLAPLMVWDRLNFTAPKGSGRRWIKADRTNRDKPLVDTGKLLNSITVQRVTARRVMVDGRMGVAFDIEVIAAEHGNQFTEARTFSNVALGRTKSIREARNFGDIAQGREFVVRKELSVPARPWNRISRTKLQEIAESAVRGARG